MQRVERRSCLSSGKKNAPRDQQRPRELSYVRIPENKNSPPTLSSTEAEDDAEEDDSQEAEDPRPLICGGCHQAAGIIGGLGPMLACTQGHLLCQQCGSRDTVSSGCAVCGAELATLTPSRSRITRTVSQRKCILPSGDPRGVETMNVRSKPSVQPLPSNSRNSSHEVSRVSGCNYGSNGNNFRNVCSSPYEDQGQNVTVSWPSNERQLRSCCSIVTRGTDESSYTRETNVAECSRRPIRCPRLDCAVNVAFSALTHHFLFDHPEVPILSVAPGVKSTLIVSFSALSCESSRCLALLLVSDKLTGAAKRLFNGSQIHPRYQNRLPLPVLAARLHCSDERSCQDENYADGDGQEQGDVVIAWVAGLDVSSRATTGTLCCSIQVVDGTDNVATRSLTYTGPVNSLRTAQDPRQVFATGDCVILHQGFINHVTAGSASLNVNVIVY